jgi:hypothetical protein
MSNNTLTSNQVSYINSLDTQLNNVYLNPTDNPSNQLFLQNIQGYQNLTPAQQQQIRYFAEQNIAAMMLVQSAGVYININSFVNSWGNYGSGFNSGSYTLDFLGNVRLRGAISGGSSGTIAFTLPSGYIPPASCYFITYSNDTSAHTGRILIDSSGNVTVSFTGTTTYVSLEGIVFSVNN